MASYACLFFFALVLASTNLKLSSCLTVKGSVNCLDCNPHHDLSGIRVLVKCNKVKKIAATTTLQDGSFETELPASPPPTNSNCMANIFGGSSQLYTWKKTMAVTVIKTHDHPLSYTTSEPLTFYKSCPLSQQNNIANCGHTKTSGFGDSKTPDFPPASYFGLPPSANFIPFFPIIGIP